MSWFSRNRKVKIRGTKEEIRQIAHDLVDHKVTTEEIQQKYDSHTCHEAFQLASLLVQGIDAEWLFS